MPTPGRAMQLFRGRMLSVAPLEPALGTLWVTARTSLQQQVNAFCNKSQRSWEAGNSLGVLTQIPVLNAASLLLICLQENATLQAQTCDFADVETCGIFPVGMSSQNGGGRRSPSWLVQVLACVLSSARRRLSEGLARRAVSRGGVCVTRGDKARCWMHKVVPLPNPASFASPPGLACANGISAAPAARVQPALNCLCLKHTVIQPVAILLGLDTQCNYVEEVLLIHAKIIKSISLF